MLLKKTLNESIRDNDQACMSDNGSSLNANVKKCINAMMEEE